MTHFFQVYNGVNNTRLFESVKIKMYYTCRFFLFPNVPWTNYSTFFTAVFL